MSHLTNEMRVSQTGELSGPFNTHSSKKILNIRLKHYFMGVKYSRQQTNKRTTNKSNEDGTQNIGNN